MNRNLNLESLFNSVGIKKAGAVEMNDNTYDFDPEMPKDHWLHPVLRGFLELKRRGLKIKSFATIGTGGGLDAIGAYEVFKPKQIFMTDIHPAVPEVAEKNVRANTGNDVKITSLQGDLCSPLIERGLKADLVYANIPNLPSDQPVLEGKKGASMYEKKLNADCPEIFQRYQLTLQYLFLKQAPKILTQGGIVVDALGARVPYELLERLFLENGYKNISEIASTYKIQSEPEDTLEGYAQAEQDYGVRFDFYDHEAAQQTWQEIENKKLTTPELKKLLEPYKLSAGEAFKRWKAEGKNSGHICSILSANHEAK